MAINIPITIKGKDDVLQLGRLLKELGIEGDKAFDLINQSAKKSQSQVGSFGKSVKGFLASAGLLFGAREVIQGFKQIVTSASDMNEAMNLVNQTFGESADIVTEFSDNAVQSLAISKGEALALTGELGSLVKSLGFTEQASAQLSTTAIKLAADIGSFKNARTEEVFVAIRAALIGSSEPMLRFGSDTRQAALQQFALREGIIDTNRELTSQERAFVALRKIMDDNKDAIGDVERTSKEFAVGSKIFLASLVTFGERVGTALLPHLNTLVQRFNELLTDKNIDRMIKVVNILLLLPKFTGTVTNIGNAAEAFSSVFVPSISGAADSAESFKKQVQEMLDVMNQLEGQLNNGGDFGNVPEGNNPFERSAMATQILTETMTEETLPAMAKLAEDSGFVAANIADAPVHVWSQEMEIAAFWGGQLATVFNQAFIFSKGLEQSIANIAKQLAATAILNFFRLSFAGAPITPAGLFGIPTPAASGASPQLQEFGGTNFSQTNNINLNSPQGITQFQVDTVLIPALNDAVDRGLVLNSSGTVL